MCGLRRFCSCSSAVATAAQRSGSRTEFPALLQCAELPLALDTLEFVGGRAEEAEPRAGHEVAHHARYEDLAGLGDCLYPGGDAPPPTRVAQLIGPPGGAHDVGEEHRGQHPLGFGAWGRSSASLDA